VELEAPIRSPLATDGSRIFFVTRDGLLHALERATGRSAWVQAVPEGSTVAASAALVVVRHPDGHVVARDAASGMPRWKARSGVSGNLAPVIDGDQVLVAGLGISALRLADGRLIWGAPGTPALTAPPVSSAGRVLVAEAGGVLRCRERSTGMPLWSFDAGAEVLAAPASDGRSVFFGTAGRSFLSVDLEKGRRRWRRRLGADVHDPALVVDDLVIFASLEAVLYALNKGNGHLTWRRPLPSRPLGGPVPLETTALIATRDTDILGFVAADGRRLGRTQTSAELVTPPLVLEDQLVLGQRNPWSLTVMGLDLTPRIPGRRRQEGAERRGRPASTPADEPERSASGKPERPASPEP